MKEKNKLEEIMNMLNYKKCEQHKIWYKINSKNKECPMCQIIRGAKHGIEQIKQNANVFLSTIEEWDNVRFNDKK